MAQANDADDDDVMREFTPQQASTKNEPDTPREIAKDSRDELEFAENVDAAETDLEKQRRSPQHAAGITNRPLDEEERQQQKLPERNVRKAPGR